MIADAELLQSMSGVLTVAVHRAGISALGREEEVRDTQGCPGRRSRRRKCLFPRVREGVVVR